MPGDIVTRHLCIVLIVKSILDLKAGSAPTRLDNIRVHEFESALAKVVGNEVDDGAIEVRV